MEAILQFTGGSGAAVPSKEKEPGSNPWLGVLDASLGATQENIFEEFVSDWDKAIRASVILGSMLGSIAPGASVIAKYAKYTNHVEALRVLDAAMAESHSDDESIWEDVKSELQTDRTSSRKLFK